MPARRKRRKVRVKLPPRARHNLKGIALRSLKLTDKDVRWIKMALIMERRMRPPTHRRCRHGFKARLAAKFGVSVELIREIEHGRKWRHLRASLPMEKQK